MKPSIAILLFACVLFMGKPPLPAQVPCGGRLLPQEQVVLHLDRNVCLAGETLWFKAWCFLDGELKRAMSQVLYVEIFDESGKAIVRQKHLLKHNSAAGSIYIPEDVPGKYYFLKAYTRYMRNFSSGQFHYQQLVIANPYIENARIIAEAPAVIEQEGRLYSAGAMGYDAGQRIRIRLAQKQVLPRQPVAFSISSPEQLTASLSATVRLKGLGNHPAPQVMRRNAWLQASCARDPYCQSNAFPGSSGDGANEAWAAKPLSPEGKGLEWLPETRGLTISGFIQNDRQERAAGVPLTAAVLQQEPMVHMGITDETGAFTLSLQAMQQQKEVFVGTPEANHRVFIRNDFDTNLPPISAVPLRFDSSLHQLLSGLNLHQQLTQAYPAPTTAPVFQPEPIGMPSTNILGPDRRIVLADYIEVPTMAEVFNEITTGVTLRKSGGATRLSVFNPEGQEWVDHPLVLLDNVPVYDIEALLKIDPALVEAVEIFHSDYIIGDFTVEAIVAITTETDDFAGYQWSEQVAFTAFKAYAVPQPFEQVVDTEKSHYPDFRPVLYWKPDLQLRPGQPEERITVIAPDRPGVYEVVVQGFTPSGEPCLGYAAFEVVQER
jgi:hypothetical protein